VVAHSHINLAGSAGKSEFESPLLSSIILQRHPPSHSFQLPINLVSNTLTYLFMMFSHTFPSHLKPRTSILKSWSNLNHPQSSRSVKQISSAALNPNYFLLKAVNYHSYYLYKLTYDTLARIYRVVERSGHQFVAWIVGGSL
jgi:hypothetical protein